MVNLKEKPYYLKDEDIKWVEDTIASMTTEEKIGQLFMNMVADRSEGKFSLQCQGGSPQDSPNPSPPTIQISTSPICFEEDSD